MKNRGLNTSGIIWFYLGLLSTSLLIESIFILQIKFQKNLSASYDDANSNWNRSIVNKQQSIASLLDEKQTDSYDRKISTNYINDNINNNNNSNGTDRTQVNIKNSKEDGKTCLLKARNNLDNQNTLNSALLLINCLLTIALFIQSFIADTNGSIDAQNDSNHKETDPQQNSEKKVNVFNVFLLPHRQNRRKENKV